MVRSNLQIFRSSGALSNADGVSQAVMHIFGCIGFETGNEGRNEGKNADLLGNSNILPTPMGNEGLFQMRIAECRMRNSGIR